MERLAPKPASRNLSGEDKIQQINATKQTGQSKFGMQTFNQSHATLYHRKLITLEAALAHSSSPDELRRLMGGSGGIGMAA